MNIGKKQQRLIVLDYARALTKHLDDSYFSDKDTVIEINNQISVFIDKYDLKVDKPFGLQMIAKAKGWDINKTYEVAFTWLEE